MIHQRTQPPINREHWATTDNAEFIEHAPVVCLVNSGDARIVRRKAPTKPLAVAVTRANYVDDLQGTWSDVPGCPQAPGAKREAARQVEPKRDSVNEVGHKAVAIVGVVILFGLACAHIVARLTS